MAMYTAKKESRSVKIFTGEMEKEYRYKLNIENELAHAVKAGEISLVYQPQIDRKGGLTGVETLVRWNNEKLGQVPPLDFITVAENSDRIGQIGAFIMRTALKEIREVQDICHRSFTVSINVSVKQFLMNDFFSILDDALEQTGIDEKRLVLEIIESLFINDLNLIIPILRKVKERG